MSGEDDGPASATREEPDSDSDDNGSDSDALVKLLEVAQKKLVEARLKLEAAHAEIAQKNRVISELNTRVTAYRLELSKLRYPFQGGLEEHESEDRPRELSSATRRRAMSSP
jgi:hypothetical protein